MLVLARTKNKSIVISDNITVTILQILDASGKEVAGGKVRLGVEAPREIPVYRQEMYEQIQRQPPSAPNP